MLYLLLCYTLLACRAGDGRSFIPHVPGYNQDNKEVIVLDDELLEISGMFYQDDGKIAANNDETGAVFILNPSSGMIESHPFAGEADYEDIVLAGRTYFVLESNGNIHQVPLDSGSTYKEHKFKAVKKTEFESMYFEKTLNRLVLITKDHRQETRDILAYAFDLNTLTYTPEPVFTISMKDVSFHLKDITADCKPSGAAIHPILNKLFVVASIGKVLFQCSLEGKVEKVFQINPVQFPQPEGITFAPNGDMYISNEGIQGKATVLRFPYQATAKL